MDWKKLLGGVAPVLSSVLSVAGPPGVLAGAALSAVSTAILGTPNGTADAVASAIQKGLPPDAIVALQKADDDMKTELAKQVTLQGQQIVDNAKAINDTMQAEVKADHWPTYSWRPFIGFCFGAMGLISGGTAAACYLGVMFTGLDPKVLSELPALVGSEAAVMATMSPVLGIASWFRGQMQANPAVPSDPRG